ncbi:MAG: MotA/TolQ/ExbB proton channel family protein [Acidobacteria bacterium]|nr:MotA/TolQ/ExbB proton channel family protein [Acidobacteriota bacterium]
MWSYFLKGGPVMWPLLLLSILGITVVVWRAVALREATRDVSPFMGELRKKLLAFDLSGAIRVCSSFPGPVASLVKAGLLRSGQEKDKVEATLQDASAHELARLERGLPALATVATIAPLLGFLGTVTGMIRSFDALASVGLNNPSAVAKGISEALITTAAGLMIAIPVQMAYNYFTTRINSMTRAMEAAANAVLDAMADIDSERAPAGDIRRPVATGRMG